MSTNANVPEPTIDEAVLHRAKLAWDVVVKVAAQRAAEYGLAPSHADMPAFEQILANVLQADTEKQAQAQAAPGIYSQFAKQAGVSYQDELRQSAINLASDPTYADLFV